MFRQQKLQSGGAGPAPSQTELSMCATLPLCWGDETIAATMKTPSSQRSAHNDSFPQRPDGRRGGGTSLALGEKRSEIVQQTKSAAPLPGIRTILQTSSPPNSPESLLSLSPSMGSRIFPQSPSRPPSTKSPSFRAAARRIGNSLSLSQTAESGERDVWISKIFSTSGMFPERTENNIGGEADPQASAVPVFQDNRLYIVDGALRHKKCIEVFDPVSTTWKVVDVKGIAPKANAGFTVTSIRKKFLVYGGNVAESQPRGQAESRTRSGEVFTFDIVQMKWSSTPVSNAFPRQHHTASLVDAHRLFIYGGSIADHPEGNIKSSKFQSDLIVLDVQAMQISEPCIAGEAPPNRQGHSAVQSSRGVIVIFGGKVGDVCVNDLLLIDSKSNRWLHPKARGTPPLPRHSHTATFVDDSMIVFGGRNHWGNHFFDLHVLDTVGMEWSCIPLSGQTPKDLLHYSLQSCSSTTLFLFGGSSSSCCISLHCIQPSPEPTGKTARDRSVTSFKKVEEITPNDSRSHIRDWESFLTRTDQLLVRIRSVTSPQSFPAVPPHLNFVSNPTMECAHFAYEKASTATSNSIHGQVSTGETHSGNVEQYAKEVHRDLCDLREEAASRVQETTNILVLAEDTPTEQAPYGEELEVASRRIQKLELEIRRVQRQSLKLEREILTSCSAAVAKAYDKQFTEKLEDFLADMSASHHLEVPETVVYCQRHGVRKPITGVDTTPDDSWAQSTPRLRNATPRQVGRIPANGKTFSSLRPTSATVERKQQTPPWRQDASPHAHSLLTARTSQPGHQKPENGEWTTPRGAEGKPRKSSAWLKGIEACLGLSDDTPSSKIKLWIHASSQLQHMSQGRLSSSVSAMLSQWQTRRDTLENEVSGFEHEESAARDLVEKLQKRMTKLEIDVVRLTDQRDKASRTAIVALAKLHLSRAENLQQKEKLKDTVSSAWGRFARRYAWRVLMASLLKKVVRQKMVRIGDVTETCSGEGSDGRKKTAISVSIKELVKQNDDLRLQVASLGTMRKCIQDLKGRFEECCGLLDDTAPQSDEHGETLNKLRDAIEASMLEVLQKSQHVVEEGFVQTFANRQATEKNKLTMAGKEVKLLNGRLREQQERIRLVTSEMQATRLLLVTKEAQLSHLTKEHTASMSKAEQLQHKVQELGRELERTPHADLQTAIESRDLQIQDLERALMAERTEREAMQEKLLQVVQERREVECAFLLLFEQVKEIRGGPCDLADTRSSKNWAAKMLVQERQACEAKEAAFLQLQRA